MKMVDREQQAPEDDEVQQRLTQQLAGGVATGGCEDLNGGVDSGVDIVGLEWQKRENAARCRAALWCEIQVRKSANVTPAGNDRRPLTSMKIGLL